MWDARVRSYLGERYDSGKNIYDMDFSMKLKERATLLDFNEYASWRKSGMYGWDCFIHLEQLFNPGKQFDGNL